MVHKYIGHSFRLCTFLCFLLGPVFAQKAPIPDQLPQDMKTQLLRRLPPDWQTEVNKYQIFDEYNFRYLYARSTQVRFLSIWTDDALRYRIMRYLSGTPGAEDFVLDHLADPLVDSHARQALYLGIGNDERGIWTSNSRIASALEHAALTEPDPEVSMAAFDALHMIEAHRLRDVVERRLSNDRFANGGTGVANQQEQNKLLKEDQSLNLIMDGINLPEFLSNPPPVFAVKTNGSSVRAVIIGDYGTMDKDHENQKKVADAMIAYSKKKPFDFGLTVGDNFYFKMKSPHDPLWKADFEDLYSPLHITFYPSFGNHDWDGLMPAIELLHSENSAAWQFPAPYYTYTAGPVQLFVINTGNNADLALDREQLTWLKTELDKSTARWKIVYGHYPVKDNELGISWSVYDRLMPILKGRADLYIAGHLHNFEHLKPEGDVNLVVVTSAGQAGPGGHDFDSDAFYVKDAVNGFAVLEANPHDLTMRFVDSNGKQIYDASWHK